MLFNESILPQKSDDLIQRPRRYPVKFKISVPFADAFFIAQVAQGMPLLHAVAGAGYDGF